MGERPGDQSELDELLAHPARFLDHPEAAVRRLAVAACERLDQDAAAGVVAGCLAGDPDPTVRAAAAEVLGRCGPAALEAVWAARTDPDARVVEAVAHALGELSAPAALDWLVERARTDDDPLVQEASVAALGAIGDARALPTLVDLAASGAPQLRRRAVVALTAFEGPEVDAALSRARLDRNPMVREVAEMAGGGD